MSYDLTLFHGPTITSFAEVLARLDAPGTPTSAQRSKLEGSLAELRALFPASDGATSPWSSEPVMDAAAGTLGLCLVGSEAAAVLERILPMLKTHGLVCYDPQDGVAHYANGTNSRDEQNDGDGIHEGVDICLRELMRTPPPSPKDQLESLEALGQFVLVDSKSLGAAATKAVPVIVPLVGCGDDMVRHRVAELTRDICSELRDRGEAVAFGKRALAAVTPFVTSKSSHVRAAANTVAKALARLDEHSEKRA